MLRAASTDGKRGFWRGWYSQRLPIEHQDLAGVSLSRLLVKPLAGFVAEPFLLDHLLLEFERQKALAPGIVRNKFVQIGSDEPPHVEAHQIEQAEAGAVRNADERSGERVHFFDAEIFFQHHLADGAAHETTDPIGDEVGRVLGAYHSFAEAPVGKLFDIGENRRIGFRARDQLHQMQIARRIEEMRAQEVAAETGREAFRDVGERDAAGVGGKDGIGFARGFNFVPQRALGLEVFDDGFDNPVAVRELSEIVLEVARFDERGFIVGEESAGTLLQGVLNALQRRRVAIRFVPVTSRSSAGMPALAKCAAMREPMVPAPRTRNPMNGSHAGALQIHGAHVLLGIARPGGAALRKHAIDFAVAPPGSARYRAP